MHFPAFYGTKGHFNGPKTGCPFVGSVVLETEQESGMLSMVWKILSHPAETGAENHI